MKSNAQNGETLNKFAHDNVNESIYYMYLQVIPEKAKLLLFLIFTDLEAPLLGNFITQTGES